MVAFRLEVLVFHFPAHYTFLSDYQFKQNMDDLIGIHIVGKNIDVVFVIHAQEKDALITGAEKLNLKHEEVEITSDMLKNLRIRLT